MHNNIENNLASYALKSKDSKGRKLQPTSAMGK